MEKRDWKYPVILAGVGLLMGITSWGGKFLWDDIDQIVTNTQVHSLGYLAEIFKGGTFFNQLTNSAPAASFYRPMLSVNYAIIYSLVGPSPVAFHIWQSGLYVLNSILFYWLAKKWLSEKTAFGLSLIFLVHPMNVEALAYIAALNDTAAVTCGLVALNLVHKATIKKLGIAGLFLFLGLLFKETEMVFVIATLLYLGLCERKHLTTFSYILGGVLGGYMLLRSGLGNSGNSEGPPISTRLLSMPKIGWGYIQTFLWPAKLVIGQKWWVNNISIGDFWGPLAGVIITTGTVATFVKQIWKSNKEMGKVALLGTGILAIGVGLHLQIVPLDFTVVEKWFYVPMLGLLLIIGLWMESAGRKYFKNKIVMTSVFLILITGLFIRSIIRIQNWQDADTLLTHDIAASEPNGYLQALYGLQLYLAGKPDEALSHYLVADSLAYTGNPPWYNMAVIYEQKKELQKAEEYYQKALTVKNMPQMAYESASIAAINNQHPLLAVETIITAQNIFKNNPRLWMLLAIAWQHAGNKNEAVNAAKTALQLSPDSSGEEILQKIQKDILVIIN